MTLKAFGRFLLSYAAATVAVATMSWAASEALSLWGLTFKTAFLVLWMCTVGWLGISYTVTKLGASLGIRPGPVLAVNTWRSIPIIGGLGHLFGDAVQSVIPGLDGRGNPSIDLPASFAFLAGAYVFPEDECKELLAVGWRRQRRGQGAFVRSHWLDRSPFFGDRAMYDAWCDCCEVGGFLVNRKPRHPGKMTQPPLLALSALRHSIRRVQIN